jgi:signal transduction histidine kinase
MSQGTPNVAFGPEPEPRARQKSTPPHFRAARPLQPRNFLPNSRKLVRVKQREADGEGDESSVPSVLVESGLALAMLEGLPTPLCLRDRQSRYVWANAAFRSAFGRAKSELIGKTDFDLLPHEQALLEQIRDERVFRDGQDLFFEDRASYPSTLVGISGWHLPVRRPNQKAVEYVLRQWGPSGSAPSPDPALTPDAEESVRLLKEQQSELLKKERLIVLGQLAGSLAHQIRNPLGAISNAVAVLRRQVSGQTTPAMEQALDIAQEEVWVANRIIADLLAYSRIRPPAQRGIGVQELVEAVLGRETVPEGVSIDQRLGGERVYVDSGQVADAIANVIRNACEAMDGEGTLTIASRRDDDWVELTIADTGVGISQEEIALLFEPLITSKPLGIGLGLTTARALVANQGGTLECEGEPGKGARFKLRLPTGVTPPREPSSPSSPHVQSR